MLLHTFEIPVRSNADKELIIDMFIDNEFIVGFKELENCGLRVISHIPWSVIRTSWEIFHNCVKHYAI
jgi:hypothetical protein